MILGICLSKIVRSKIPTLILHSENTLLLYRVFVEIQVTYKDSTDIGVYTPL